MARTQWRRWGRKVVGRRGHDSARAAAGYRRRLSIEPLEERRLLAVLTVTTDKDYTSPGDGRVTLREAIIAANTDTTTDLGETGSGVDTIVFAPWLDGDTILLDGTEIQITAALMVDASSLTSNVTVDAGGQSRIFNITALSGDFSFFGLTLTGGVTFNDNTASGNMYSGGALRSLSTGSLTLNRSTVSDNHTEGRLADGGGIFALGDVTLIDSTVSGNYTVDDLASGGGIFSAGYVVLDDSTVSGNATQGGDSTGGGIYAYLGASLTDSTVSDNHTEGDDAPGGGLFVGGDATLNSSTVSGNYTQGANAHGGGIYALGNGMFTDSTISGNHTEGGDAAGGGAWIDGDLTVTDGTFDGNHTQGDFAHGGGMYVGGGLTFAESTASGNYTLGDFARGGAMYGNDDLDPLSISFIVLTDSTLSGNYTEGIAAFGGAVFASATSSFDDSTLTGNYTLGNTSRGGAIWANSAVTISRTMVSNNYTKGDSAFGGGIHALDDVTLTDSTLSGNHTEGVSAVGGGINGVGDVTVTQSTVSGNYTLGNYADGAGVKAEGRTVIIYSTVADNYVSHPSTFGGGVWNGSAPLFIIGSIVADNWAGGGNPDLRPGAGTLTVNHSLIGNKAGTSLTEAQTADSDGNLIGDSGGSGVIDPLLGPLADNGGPTETRALLAGSPAIDAGDRMLVAGEGDVSDYDQRGPIYYRIVDGGIGPWMDMGAFEFGNIEPGSIHGQKWYDLSGEGVKDAGEPGLEGWTIYLDLNHSGVFDSDSGTITLEPDDYTIGTALNNVQPGVTLSAVGGTTTNVFAGIPAGGRVSTGALGFISSSLSWVQTGPRLRADFDWPVSRVSIDMIANDFSDVGRLEAYDAADTLLETYVTGSVTVGDVETMEIVRATPDIAYVIASGSGSDTVNLDHLTFADSEPSTITDADGNYWFMPLTPGTYDVGEVPQPGWTQTFPTGSGMHTVTFAEGEDVMDVDFGNTDLVPLQVLPGDYNVDGMVDAADYSVWRNTRGSTSDLRADGSGPAGVPDGVVDELDYDLWKANFGRTSATGSGAILAAVLADEPAAAANEAASNQESGTGSLPAESAMFDARSALVVAGQPSTPLEDGAATASAARSVLSRPLLQADIGRFSSVADSGLRAAGPRLTHARLRAADASANARQDDALLAWLAAADDVDRVRVDAGCEPLVGQQASRGMNDSAGDAVDAVFDRLGTQRVGLIL